MVMLLLEMRERLKVFYQKFRMIINPVFKFIIGCIVFSQINGAIGYDARFTKTMVVVLLSVISAVTPGAVMVTLAMLLSLVHIYCISIFLAIFVLFAFIILYAMLLRFTPKQALVTLAIPILAKYNLHYAVPLTLGTMTNPLAILPTICGVFIYYLIEIIKSAAQRQVSLSLDDILQLYTDIADAIMANKPMIIVIIVFSLVIVMVYVVRRFSFEYSFEIAIGAGVVVNILGFLIADLMYNVTANVGVLILMSVISGIVAIAIQFFKRVLDYTAVERVQFEDDDYYYYVKAVPKVKVGIPKLDVKHINRKIEDDQEEDYEEDYEADYEEENRDVPGLGSQRAYDEDIPAKAKRNRQIMYGYGRDDEDEGYEVEMILDEDEDEGYEVEMTLEDDEL